MSNKDLCSQDKYICYNNKQTRTYVLRTNIYVKIFSNATIRTCVLRTREESTPCSVWQRPVYFPGCLKIKGILRYFLGVVGHKICVAATSFTSLSEKQKNLQNLQCWTAFSSYCKTSTYEMATDHFLASPCNSSSWHCP